MRVRTSRVMRNRIKGKDAPRAARSIEVDRKGLLIEGKRFPYYVGEDVEVDHYGPIAFVHFSVITERFEELQHPRSGTLTHNFF